MFKAACIQMCSGCDPQENYRDADRKIRAAHKAGAKLIMLPETCNFMERTRDAMRARLLAENETPMVKQFCALAQALNVYLLPGSLIIADAKSDKAVNRSLLITPAGEIAARYDKIHLFDVTLPTGERHAESDNYAAGSRRVFCDTAFGRLGLTICYDLRFAALFRALAQGGCDFITVPSAFTVFTGEAHWHILLRARAIETGCFIFAPAQNGTHENGRNTYGHSLIINPWGEIMAEAQAHDDFILADIDINQVSRARAAIPALQHDRVFHG